MFGKYVGRRSSVATTKICRLGSELSHFARLPCYLSNASTVSERLTWRFPNWERQGDVDESP